MWRRSPASTLRPSQLAHELRSILGVSARSTGLRLVNRYDVEGIQRGAVRSAACPPVFTEPQVDVASGELPEADGAAGVCRGVPARPVRPARGLRPASASSSSARASAPMVRCAKVYLLCGRLTDEDAGQAIKHYVINPVEAARGLPREARDACMADYPEPPSRSSTLEGFTRPLDDAGLAPVHRRPRPGHGPGRPEVSARATSETRSSVTPPSPRCGWSTPTGPTTAATPPSAPTSTDVEIRRRRCAGRLSTATSTCASEVYGREGEARL